MKNPYLKLLEELFSDLTDTDVEFVEMEPDAEITFESDVPDLEFKPDDTEWDYSLEDLSAEIEYIEDSLCHYTDSIDDLNKRCDTLEERLDDVLKKQDEILKRLDDIETKQIQVPTSPFTWPYPYYPNPYSPPYTPGTGTPSPIVTWTTSSTGDDEYNGCTETIVTDSDNVQFTSPFYELLKKYMD